MGIMMSTKEKANSPKKDSVSSRISSLVLSYLKQGKVPWSLNSPPTDFIMPTSVVTGSVYTGVNWLLLTMTKFLGDTQSNAYFDMKQGFAVYGEDFVKKKLIKGVSPSGMIMRGVPDNGKLKFELTNVWALDAIKGVSPCKKILAKLEESRSLVSSKKSTIDTMAKLLIKNAGLTVKFTPSLECMHSVDNGIIRSPHISSFVSDSSFFRSLVHEIAHIKSVEMDLSTLSGDEDVKREMVVDIAVSMLSAEFGIEKFDSSNIEGHRNYIGEWSDLVERDPMFVILSTKKATELKDSLVKIMHKSLDREVVNEP